MRVGAFNAGDIVDEKYEVLDQIGAGGFGTVIRVKQVEDGQLLAMKYCIADTESDNFKRFSKEIKTLESVYFDNVIRIIDSELGCYPPYYIMPLAQGSLLDVAANLRTSEESVLDTFRQICNGIKIFMNVNAFTGTSSRQMC